MTEPARLTADVRAALVVEAARKSSVLWLDLPGRSQPYAAWHGWLDDAIAVVHEGIEQPLPGLATATEVTVTMRSKDNGGLLLKYRAAVVSLTPDDPRWEPVATLLHGVRQSPPDGEAQPERWAAHSQITLLVPGDVLESPGCYDDDSRRATPADSPETTLGALPLVIGRRAKRNPKL